MNSTRLRRRGVLDIVRHIGSLALIIAATAASAEAQAGRGFTTSGTRILTPTGGDFIISGINWYGFETTSYVAHGLWTKDYKYILDQAKQYGYNTIRLPFSNQLWETNPVPASGQVSACPSCAGKRARDIMAMVVNYAGSIGLHVILDNHRSNAGNSAQENGLWYTSDYPEQVWIRDWMSVQEWVHGIQQTLGAPDTVTVNTYASDGHPTVIGFDLRNEPHAPSAYTSGSTWGSGDGIDPNVDPNPNAFRPACVATSSCHDWRLAAQRAANTLLGEAERNGWEYPLIFVEGVGKYPKPGGTAASGPYDAYWWGGNLLGVNGNATNAGAPVVLNAGGDAARLGPPVYDQLVYSTHDYGPALYKQSWFNASTCYATGCSASSLADTWMKYWAYLATPAGINPVWPGREAYPWANSGHSPTAQAPVYVGEFGTGNLDTDLFTTGAGSQGQWMTSLVNFIASSYASTITAVNNPGIPVSNLHWTYWTLNTASYGVLGRSYSGLEHPKKEYSFLCFIQQGDVAVAMSASTGGCGSTGTLPAPDSSAPLAAAVPPAPAGVAATAGDAAVTLTWSQVSGAISYTVRTNAAGGEVFEVLQAGITATTFTHAGLANGATYGYTVSATNSAGEGAASSPVFATPAAPAPAPSPLSIWTPSDGGTYSGTVVFKARLENVALSNYKMYWQVNGGKLNSMYNSTTGGAHKESYVNVGGWNGTGPYRITFVARDTRGKVLAEKSVTISSTE